MQTWFVKKASITRCLKANYKIDLGRARLEMPSRARRGVSERERSDADRPGVRPLRAGHGTAEDHLARRIVGRRLELLQELLGQHPGHRTELVLVLVLGHTDHPSLDVLCDRCRALTAECIHNITFLNMCQLLTLTRNGHIVLH